MNQTTVPSHRSVNTMSHILQSCHCGARKVNRSAIDGVANMQTPRYPHRQCERAWLDPTPHVYSRHLNCVIRFRRNTEQMASEWAVFAIGMVTGVCCHEDVPAGSTLSPRQTTPHHMTCAVLALYKASGQGKTGDHMCVGEWAEQLETMPRARATAPGNGFHG